MKKLNYLILTDIHFNLNFLSYLKTQEFKNLEGILILGDLVNANHEEPFTNSLKDEEEFEQVLELARDIHPKVFFIPGNHDPEKYFKDNGIEGIEKYPINLHKKIFRINDNLVFIGLGGSVHSYLKNCNDQLVWKGYPYETEEEFEFELDSLFDSILNDDNKDSLIKEGDSILLLTHTGPSNIDTTQINNYPSNRYKTEISSGSQSLYNFLINEKVQKLAFPSNPLRPSKKYPQLAITNSKDNKIKYHLIANLHGHSHASWGMTGNLGAHLPIINPGSLQDGKFLVIELSEINPIPDSSSEHPILLNKVWSLTSVEFKTIW